VVPKATLLFETRGLCKHYRHGSQAEVRALDQVSLGIECGSFTVVTGPSGSGKTTLLALLGALERPTSGRVYFDSYDLTDCSDVALARARRRMGFVFQDFALIPNLTAEENISYPLIPRGVPRTERKRRARSTLAQLGLEDKLAVRAWELSGGEQQRVAIARALAGEPEVILADEPTSNLDADASSALLAIFRTFHAVGKTLVLSSHDPAVIALATRMHQLHRGSLK
jgi:putative ABC transport system ATP-binding protein